MFFYYTGLWKKYSKVKRFTKKKKNSESVMKIWKICYILYNSYTVTTQTSFFLKSVRSDWNLEVENNSTLTKNVAEFSLEQMKTVLSFIPWCLVIGQIAQFANKRISQVNWMCLKEIHFNELRTTFILNKVQNDMFCHQILSVILFFLVTEFGISL